MSNIKIVVDSSCDIPYERFDEMDLTLAPLSVVFGDKQFKDYIEMDMYKFAEMVKKSKDHPTTALVSIEDADAILRKFINDGNEIIAATLSSAGSGTYNVFCLAKQALEEEFGHPLPIRIVDSKAFTVAHGMPIYDAVKMRDEGAGLDEIADMLEKTYNEEHYKFWALLSDLSFLKRGGRLKAGAAIIGGILGVLPILSIEDGLVVPKGKARGFDNALDTLIDNMAKDFPSKKLQRCSIAYHGIDDKVKRFAELISQNFELETEIDIVPAHGTIMTHSGTNFLAIAYK